MPMWAAASAESGGIEGDTTNNKATPARRTSAMRSRQRTKVFRSGMGVAAATMAGMGAAMTSDFAVGDLPRHGSSVRGGCGRVAAGMNSAVGTTSADASLRRGVVARAGHWRGPRCKACVAKVATEHAMCARARALRRWLRRRWRRARLERRLSGRARGSVARAVALAI